MANESIIIRGAGIIAALIIGVYTCLGRHIGNKGRHPNSEDLVFKDVCEERGKNNVTEHKHLKEGIQQAMNRSDERHKEVKEDLAEIKALIRNGH